MLLVPFGFSDRLRAIPDLSRSPRQAFLLPSQFEVPKLELITPNSGRPVLHAHIHCMPPTLSAVLHCDWLVFCMELSTTTVISFPYSATSCLLMVCALGYSFLTSV